MNNKLHSELIYKMLIDAVGKDKVSINNSVLKDYSNDMTEIDGHKPDYLISASSKDDIISIVAIARDNNIPITPVVANTNIGGLAIPNMGGIILDLKNMNRIIEVNEEDSYMLIEPGVTFGQVKEYLDTHHPSLRFGYSLSPPYTSVLANCLLDGLGNLSLKHGAMGDWINGLEAVLANGDIIKTGSGAYSNNWCSSSPMPDLTGLFLNFHATTGIVTQMSVQLWPNLIHRKRLFVLTYDIDVAYSIIKRLTRENLFDDIGGISWPLAKMLFGVKYPTYKDPNEPIIFIYLDISSNYEKEINLKLDILGDILNEFRKNGAQIEDPFDVDTLIKINPAFKKFSEFPTELDFLLDHGGGGLTWIGTYGPISQWENGVKIGHKIMEERGFSPSIVTRPMRGGHFGVLRFITLFNKEDQKDIERVKELNITLCKAVLDLGFIPYKTPNWVIQLMKEKLDPAFLKWVANIKKLFDPYGIMNPGKWDV
ncbi:MAG: FAD-binding oxidoreductase [Spirochaetota bacterium]|nr:FAD-binding oxidoreductase [Spirochaetota bacterium]